MKKMLRIILVWSLISLFLQYGAYSFLDHQVAKVLNPEVINAPITEELKATIPGTDLKNIQISYAKDYIAYMEKGTLKVFNLKKEKIVFEKKPPVNASTLGVLSYQWLPDRDTLLYFYAKKNPNPVTYVKVPVKSTHTTTQPVKKPNPEDPNQKATETKKETVVETRVEAKYGNPQITQLYTLELPDSNEDTQPDDRFNHTIEEFSANGEIEDIVVSTTTNLIYLTVKKGSTQQLLEIDVMKNVRSLNKQGEIINGMAASDRYGTLFINSLVNGSRKVVALGVGERKVISDNVKDRVLGIRDGKIYIGEVSNGQLVKIKTTEDKTEIKEKPPLKTEWTGTIPFNNVETTIGSHGQIVINDEETAYVISDGNLEEIKLSGEKNYISDDGVELIQLTKTGVSTLAELSPLRPVGK